jgi:hypothetical protein
MMVEKLDRYLVHGSPRSRQPLPENSQDLWRASLAARWGPHLTAKSVAGARVDSTEPQQLKSPTHYICEIFGAPRFSSFSKQSRKADIRHNREVS